ncbi:hypothetical protein GE061_000147 [Apolygus lucorum]|uniref:TGF-beta family profile domain-containing protein n=1 Tax=Apolygus lucorum TaxID=248454 RepID=A0A6A4KN99_APOLU|nr:hypothetical protein GE061_000147 [Apolygus lucorum]
MGCFRFRSLLVSFVLSVSLVFSVHGGPESDTILQSLGLNSKPDVRKMNVSQEEFTKKMSMYLKRTRRSAEPRRFFTVRPEEVERRESGEELLKFRSEEWGEAEGATLKMLVVGASSVSVYQRNSDGSEALVNAKELSPGGSPLWVDSHLVPQENENGNSSLIVARVVCSPKCQVLEPVVNVISRIPGGRFRRQLDRFGRTDCEPVRVGSKKQNCCRHKMNVVFKQLKGYEYIVAPFNFDAGYCGGPCPFRFNEATHHASLQAVMNRYRKGVPRPCCAPKKLIPLDIITLDEDDPNKLKVIKWDNAQVIECACF